MTAGITDEMGEAAKAAARKWLSRILTGPNGEKGIFPREIDELAVVIAKATFDAAPSSTADDVHNAAIEACAQVACGISDKYSQQARDLWKKPGEGKAVAAETAADEIEAAIRALRRGTP